MKAELYHHSARILANKLLGKYSEGIGLNHSGQNKIFTEHLVVGQPNIYKELAESLLSDDSLQKFSEGSDLGYVSEEVSSLVDKTSPKLEKLNDQYIKQYANLRIKGREPNYVSYEKQVYNLDKKFHDTLQEYGIGKDTAFQLMTVLKLNSLYANIAPHYEGKAEPEYTAQSTLDIGKRKDTEHQDIVHNARSQINREAIFILNNHSENILVGRNHGLVDSISRALVVVGGKQTLETTEVDSEKDFDPHKLQRFISKILNNDLILSSASTFTKEPDRALWDSIINGIEDNYNLGHKIAQSSMASIKESTKHDVIDIKVMQGYLNEYKEQSLSLLLSAGKQEENGQIYTDRTGTNRKVKSFLEKRGYPKEKIEELSSYLKSLAYEEAFETFMQTGSKIQNFKSVVYIPEEYQAETPKIMAPLFQRTEESFENLYKDLWTQDRSEEETIRVQKEGSRIPEQFRNILMRKGLSRDLADYFTMSTRLKVFVNSINGVKPEEMGANSVLFNRRLKYFISADKEIQTRLREAERETLSDVFKENIDVEYNLPPKIINDTNKDELIDYSVEALINYYGSKIKGSIDSALKENNPRIAEEYSIAKKGLQSSLTGILDKEEIKSIVKSTIRDALKEALEMNRENPAINTDTLQKVEKSLRTMQK